MWDKIVLAIGKIHWPFRHGLTQEDAVQIKQHLGPHYYIILTRRRNHLSTYLIGIANLLLRGKWGFYSHVLMNLENEVVSDTDFRLIEAVGKGVVYTPFEDVFDCHWVALLKPKALSVEEWTAVLDKAKSELGKPYDTLFDLKSDSSLSCVELIRSALKAEPNYDSDFAHFERMILCTQNLTPQMFYDCPDFEVVFERRRGNFLGL